MPDWNQLVRQRLAGIELNEDETSDVVEELAGHLDESYRYFLSRGAMDQEAILMSLQEVSNWQHLRAKIESSRKKASPMNERVSQFWFPAFVTLFLSMVLLMVIQLWGPDLPAPDPLIVGSSHWRFIAPALVVYGSWLVTLPFIGALGAWLSRRAGARAKTVFLAIAFPVFRSWRFS